VEGSFPDTDKAVIIVAPHTSNWDFLVGMAVVLALELRTSWLGKHTIFKPPFQGLLRWLGGIPVDRRSRNGVVGDCVEAFAAAPALLLALSPEGTRKGVSQWKTGFHLIACGAGVPIIPASLDYRTHVVRLMPAFRPTGDLEVDLPALQALYADVEGLRKRIMAPCDGRPSS
jgi:1-acyl-sn-glycerol-3-phosphate acyltransferase